MVLPNESQDMKDIDEAGYTYLGIMETDKVKEKEMKEKFSKEYLRWVRQILRLTWDGKNKIMAVNTWVVSVKRYGAGILKWNTDEFKSLGRRTRKFMTCMECFIPKVMLIGYIIVGK